MGTDDRYVGEVVRVVISKNRRFVLLVGRRWAAPGYKRRAGDVRRARTATRNERFGRDFSGPQVRRSSPTPEPSK